MRNALIKFFAKNPFEAYNQKQVATRMGINDKAGRLQIGDLLFNLCSEGIINEHKRGKFRLNATYTPSEEPQSTLIGKVDMKSTGKAYILPENNDQEDIFIAANNTNHALHGDRVKVFLFPLRKGRRPEGRIVEILERGKNRIVGTLQLTEKYAFVVPDATNMPVDVFIPRQEIGEAKNGQKVLARLVEWPERMNNPIGEIISILGTPGENNVEMLSILAEMDFPLSFPEAVEEAAHALSQDIPQKEIERRKDFRGIPTMTIDPVDAKDFDDALSFRNLDNGHVEVGVHIADVSYYVRPNSPIDQEAYLRGTSIYLVDRTVPMLPEVLSNGLCSLRPDEDKLCYSAVFELNAKAEIISYWIGRTIIRSNKRFAYEDAQAIIEGNDGDFKPEILALHNLAQLLRNKRFLNGAINFHSTEVRFKLDENAKPIGVYVKESKEANWLIEEFMLLANKYVSEHIGKHKNKQGKARAFVYRIHAEPNIEKLSTFSQFLNKLGYQLKISGRKAIADSMNDLFANIAGKGEANMIETIAIRTMSKAYYSTENIGHYGLGFPFYSHFTSPIRRYPDLMVHRLLDLYSQQHESTKIEPLEEQCKHCSDMERRAADAERLSVKYKQAEYLKDRIGEEFDGIISGVSKYGIFVELSDNKCEGMVSLQTLSDDLYFLDEENYQVLGRRYGHAYKLGDPVRIQVQRVDLAKKQMDFSLCETPCSTPRKPIEDSNRIYSSIPSQTKTSSKANLKPGTKTSPKSGQKTGQKTNSRSGSKTKSKPASHKNTKSKRK